MVSSPCKLLFGMVNVCSHPAGILEYRCFESGISALGLHLKCGCFKYVSWDSLQTLVGHISISVEVRHFRNLMIWFSCFSAFCSGPIRLSRVQSSVSAFQSKYHAFCQIWNVYFTASLLLLEPWRTCSKRSYETWYPCSIHQDCFIGLRNYSQAETLLHFLTTSSLTLWNLIHCREY